MQIKYKEGICSDCGDKKLIAQKSLNLCLICNSRRLNKIYNERKKIRYEKGEKVDKSTLNKFYRDVWDSQPHVCFETGSTLWTYHKWCVHHLLEKELYPELASTSDVCVLLTLEQHANWHSLAPSDRKRKMPKTYERYLQVLKKYDYEQYKAKINSGIESY